jgi:hypothetical protein
VLFIGTQFSNLYTAVDMRVPNTKLGAWGEEDSEEHVL